MGDTRVPADWSAPGAWEVAPDVYRIPLHIPNDGLHAVNVYAICSGGRLTIVDSGWAVPIAEQQLVSALRSIGAEVSDVGHFAVTHAHRDHYTLAVELRERYGTTVSLGEGERPTIEAVLAGWGRGLEAQFERLLAAGAADLVGAVRVWLQDPPSYARVDDRFDEPDVWLADGDKVLAGDRVLQVLATPGHTAGHVVFTDLDAGLLFSGDHVLPHITPSISFEPITPVLPLKHFMSSLNAILQLPDLRLLPAHGQVLDHSHARAEQLIRHHENRLVEIGSAVADGARTGAEAAAAIRWTRHGRRLDELDIFNQILAVNETAAHLELLVDRGMLDADQRGKAMQFGPA